MALLLHIVRFFLSLQMKDHITNILKYFLYFFKRILLTEYIHKLKLNDILAARIN